MGWKRDLEYLNTYGETVEQNLARRQAEQAQMRRELYGDESFVPLGRVVRGEKLKSPEMYERVLREQGGVCALCKRPPSPGAKLVFDHDHRCHPTRVCKKCFRGLLCSRCNTGLGLVDLVGIEAIQAYLSTFHLGVS